MAWVSYADLYVVLGREVPGRLPARTVVTSGGICGGVGFAGSRSGDRYPFAGSTTSYLCVAWPRDTAPGWTARPPAEPDLAEVGPAPACPTAEGSQTITPDVGTLNWRHA
ncbi:hypothetical protein P3T39_002299 [Kitasatospora sp. GP82]|nr:hypothetical protein [Kitasatospora sp. GP82]